MCTMVKIKNENNKIIAWRSWPSPTPSGVHQAPGQQVRAVGPWTGDPAAGTAPPMVRLFSGVSKGSR